MTEDWSKTGLQMMVTPLPIIEILADSLRDRPLRIFQTIGHPDGSVEVSGWRQVVCSGIRDACMIEIFFVSDGLESAPKDELRDRSPAQASFYYPGLCENGALPESLWGAGWLRSDADLKSMWMAVRHALKSDLSRGGRVRRIGEEWREKRDLLHSYEALELHCSGVRWTPVCGNLVTEYAPQAGA